MGKGYSGKTAEDTLADQLQAHPSPLPGAALQYPCTPLPEEEPRQNLYQFDMLRIMEFLKKANSKQLQNKHPHM